MKGYIEEDERIVRHTALPPLPQSFPSPALNASAKHAIKACFAHKFIQNVRDAQQQGVIPPDEDLAKLPAFLDAQQDDAHYIQRAEQEAASRAEARRKAAERAQRLAAERQRRAAEEAAAAAQQRQDAKEARRLARFTAKTEAHNRTVLAEQRRYEELLSRWESTLHERQSKLNEVENEISTASERKTFVAARIAELSEEKSTLLRKLRDLASRPSVDSLPAAANEFSAQPAALSRFPTKLPTSPTTIDPFPPLSNASFLRDREREYRDRHHHHHHLTMNHHSSPSRGGGGGAVDAAANRYHTSLKRSRPHSPPPSSAAAAIGERERERERGGGGGGFAEYSSNKSFRRDSSPLPQPQASSPLHNPSSKYGKGRETVSAAALPPLSSSYAFGGSVYDDRTIRMSNGGREYTGSYVAAAAFDVHGHRDASPPHKHKNRVETFERQSGGVSMRPHSHRSSGGWGGGGGFDDGDVGDVERNDLRDDRGGGGGDDEGAQDYLHRGGGGHFSSSFDLRGRGRGGGGGGRYGDHHKRGRSGGGGGGGRFGHREEKERSERGGGGYGSYSAGADRGGGGWGGSKRGNGR